MRKLVLIAVLACPGLSLMAQKVENVRAAAIGEQIIINYDLTGVKSDQKLKVQLFSSHNNFTSPVTQVFGDVGENVSPGKDKRIAWNAKSELLDYKGNLSFEVRADLIVPAVAPVTAGSGQFTVQDPGSVKRGGDLPIRWSGGAPSENVKVELLKENVPQQTVTNSKNTGNYSWNVPSDMKPGTYQLKVTGSSGSGVSSPFAIKHKIPTVVKVLPAVIIIGVVAASGGGGGGDGGSPSGGDKTLPVPATPTGE